MERRRLVGAVAGLIGTMVAGTSAVAGRQATPLPDALPGGTAPFGLSGVVLPTTWEDVSDLFARLPHRVYGLDRNPSDPAGRDRVRVTYGAEDAVLGAPLVLQALDFRASDFFPRDFTPGMYVAMAAGTADTGATGFGQDQGLAWILAETSAATEGVTPGTPETVRTLHTLAWGATSGHVLLTAAATTPEGLAALLTAFVDAIEHDVD